MTQQMSAGRPYFGGRGFSSASATGGLGGHRTYVASAGQPIANGYRVRRFSSQSVSNLGGSRRISHGSYGGYGTGCYGGYGAYGYGHMGYGTLGFGGRMSLAGNGGLIGGHAYLRGDGIRGVTINEKLLQPLHVGVDPQEQEARNHEREEMKTLNDQFACFIDKVRHLEQQNKVLDTKWRLLQECALPAKKDLSPYYENFISNMKKQLECLLSERDQLISEEASIQQLVEEFKTGYEDELKKRTTAENEFVLLKKDVDGIFLSKAELEGKVDLLSREMEFRTCVHAEELAQLDCHVCDTNILLEMDNSRNIDVDQIIKNVEAWYQSIAQRSKEEANALYENRFLELQEQRGKYSDGLKINQHAIADLTRLLSKLQSEHDIVKKQVDCLQTSICDVEQRGDVALKDARDKHTELQTALQKAKDDLALLLKDYHELLNTKLALDIEIATYKTMLEGEESRICAGNFVSIDVVKPPYAENAIGYQAPLVYGAVGGGYGGVGGLDYGTDFWRGFGQCRRRRSYCGGAYGGDYSGGCSVGYGGRSGGQYGRRRSWSGSCGGGYGQMGGGSGRGSGESSGRGYGECSGRGYGESSGRGYGESSGRGHGESSGRGSSRADGVAYSGEYGGGRRGSRSGESRSRMEDGSMSRGRSSGDAEYSGRGGYSSGSAQGSSSNMGQRGVSGGRMDGSRDGGWAVGGCPPGYGIPFGGGGYVPKIVGQPVIIGGGPGVVGGADMGCGPAVGMPAVGISPVCVPGGGIGTMGMGRMREPYVEVISPSGVCYPGAVGAPVGVCYPGQGGPFINAKM